MKMRCVGIGKYDFGPGQIEKQGDFGWRIDQGREIVDGIQRDKVVSIQIAIYCPRTHVCFQHVRQGPVGSHGEDSKQRWWAWNGNFEAPTLTPSIGCDDLRTRCGQHVTITDGEMSGVILP